MNSHKSYTETLPKKRMGAGCLFFNERGEILFVKPTYKPDWEIPGGVVEHNESPKQCCAREVAEELGLSSKIGELLVVDYNGETQDRTESLMFIFNGGALSDSDIESIRLPNEELSEYRFFSAENLPNELPQPLRARVLMAWQQALGATSAYLENQISV